MTFSCTIVQINFGALNFGIIFLSVCLNISYLCSKEPSRSFEYQQHMFWLRNKKIFFDHALLSTGANPAKQYTISTY